MLKTRLVAVLILRNGQVVQSVRFKHTNIIHADPIHAVEAFNKWAVDEIVLLNVTREQNSRDQFLEKVRDVSRQCFVPLTAGGWVVDESYARALLRSGADKLVVNTALADDPELVKMLARRFGQQCVVGSIDVIDTEHGERVCVDRARRVLEWDATSWARHAVGLGCGEILLNSVNHDGARKGYKLATLAAVASAVPVPVIAFGGVQRWQHLVEGVQAGAAAVAAANIFHYTEHATRKAKSFLAQADVPVRSEGRSALQPH